jgi:uncharacterized membrane protein HdeD (DUF308 family)
MAVEERTGRRWLVLVSVVVLVFGFEALTRNWHPPLLVPILFLVAGLCLVIGIGLHVRR